MTPRSFSRRDVLRHSLAASAAGVVAVTLPGTAFTATGAGQKPLLIVTHDAALRLHSSELEALTKARDGRVDMVRLADREIVNFAALEQRLDALGECEVMALASPCNEMLVNAALRGRPACSLLTLDVGGVSA